MADKTELRNMVMTFRVSELQLLLGLAGQSRCGRKTELMQRALTLVDRGVSSSVQLKIKELYQKYTQRLSTGYMFNGTVQGTTSSGGTNGIHRGLSELIHNGSSNGNFTSTAVSQVPARPDVRMKHLPFCDLLAEVMKPVGLVPRSMSRQQESRLSFCLSEAQVREIVTSREVSSTDRTAVEYTNQLQLRFCVIDNSCRQPDCFPSNIIVKVNGMAAPLPTPIPTNKPGAEPKRPSRPVDITRLCRLSSSINNTIVVNWSVEDGKSHCLSVNLIKKLNSSILLQRLKRSGMCKPEQTKAMIKEKLSLDKDIEIATTSLRVSLLCPLGKMRMTIPCRATSCNHLQCFDAATFLQMNEKKATWMCPVCDRPAEFNKLVIDGLFTEILRSTSDSMEVELMKDGQWAITKTEEADDATPTQSPNPDVQSVGGDDDVIDLTETDDEAADANPRQASRTNNQSSDAFGSGSSTISSPRMVNSPIAVYDLSPLNIPMHTPPHRTASPKSSPGPLSKVPPMAHQNYPPFTLSTKFQSNGSSSHLSSSSSSSSSVMSSYSNMPMSYTPGNSHFAPGFESLLQSDPSMMDFFQLMSGMQDYAISNGPQINLPENMFDYLYQSSRAESGSDKNGHSSMGSNS